MLYTVTRLSPALIALGLWLWLRDGTLGDPANVLLLFSIAAGALGLTVVRRYWVVRKTSRSRRNSSLLD